MKIVKNEKLINRNGKIGQWTSLAALVMLGAGMYISFTRPAWFTYSVVCLILGFVMTQVGMYMGSRWGRSPRPDEKIDLGLKGLHSEFNLYHYSTPAAHFLVGPAGAWVLLPYHQRGTVAFRNGRWRLSGGGFLQGYMRIFGQEGLGRPDAEAASEVETIRRFLVRKLDTADVPEIKAMLIFTGEGIELETGDSPIPAMKLKQVKDFLRQESKKRALTADRIAAITDVL